MSDKQKMIIIFFGYVFKILIIFVIITWDLTVLTNFKLDNLKEFIQSEWLPLLIVNLVGFALYFYINYIVKSLQTNQHKEK